MKPQGVTQQWRPKAKLQCVSDAGAVEINPAPVEIKPAPPAGEVPKVIEEAEKILEKASSSLEVNQVVVQSMKKQRGRLKRKIETETKTMLSISKQNTGYCVVVEGASDAAVEKATKRLQSLLEKADTKQTKPEKIASTPKAQTSQWMPKAVKGLHTTAGAEKIKEVLAIQEDDADNVSGAIQVDKKLLRLIKGNKNEVKERIEKETNTVIKIGSPVVVEGSSEESVQKALEEIQKIIEEGVNDSKFQYSHFISLPLSLHPSLVKQLEKFQESVLIAHGIPLTDVDQEKADEEAQEQTIPEAEGEQAVEAELEGDRSEQEKTLEPEEAADVVFKNTVMISLGVPVEELGDESSDKFGAQKEAEPELAEAEQQPELVEAEQQPELGNEAAVTEELKPVVEETFDEKDGIKDDPKEVSAQGVTEGTERYEPLEDVGFSTKKTGASGIEKSIFIRPTRFHLTVLMLKLWNEDRLEKGREVLQSCLPKVLKVLDNEPLTVSLTGLEIMKGSPKNTRVLYAKVQDSSGEDKLSRACQVMIDEFVEAGLVLGKDQEQALKLHATVMNTSHRRSKSKYKNKGFDATEILASFGKQKWGDYQILEAHLSERFKYDENDYYHCCSSISLSGT